MKKPALYFTLLRVFMSPIFAVLYLQHEALGISLFWLPYIMIVLLLICEFSDIFDGFIARRRNEVTDLGKVLDPMADSIMHISLFLCFTQGVVQLPLLLVLVFLYRDFFISTIRTLCAFRGVTLAARASGKIKTIIQAIVVCAIIILMIPYTLGYLSLGHYQQTCLLAAAVAATYTAISIYDYLQANWIHIKKTL